jgi:hypothetical protein
MTSFCEIIPNPKSERKAGTTALTSGRNFKVISAKRELKMEKLKPKITNKSKSVLAVSQPAVKTSRCTALRARVKRPRYAVSVLGSNLMKNRF